MTGLKSHPSPLLHVIPSLSAIIPILSNNTLNAKMHDVMNDIKTKFYTFHKIIFFLKLLIWFPLNLILQIYPHAEL